jgi:hypothetical protein
MLLQEKKSNIQWRRNREKILTCSIETERGFFRLKNCYNLGFLISRNKGKTVHRKL